MDIQQINALDLKQMKRMKNYSLYMVQWGWFVGVIFCLGSFTCFSSLLLLPAFFFLTYGISHWYFWTRCRTEQARTCALVDSIFMMVFSGIATFMVLPIAIIFFIIAIMLFLGAKQTALWGKDRITYKQLKVAYAARKSGAEVTTAQLPTTEESNPTATTAAIVLVYIANGLGILNLV